MGFKIVFARPAISDLESLVAFISRDNSKAAEQFGYAIIARAETLKDFPFLGRIVPEFKNETLREIVYRPYRIVYRIRKEHETIEIVRVWHAARGIPKLNE